jgi:hypothetical protein
MIAALARLPLARLLRTPRTILVLAAWCALGVAFALSARRGGSAHGADHALVGAYGALLLPLLAFSVVGGALGARSLAASGAPVVAFGAGPERAAWATVAVAAAASALLGALLAAAMAVVAHGSADPPLARDALASAYAGALGGLAYAGWFSLGASFGRGGGGRALLLVVDWVLGSAGGAAALVTPRGHVRNLLGGAPPMGIPERASALFLLVLAVLYALWAARRARARSSA